MSFSKAKIRRFNEFHNDAPAPGAYHPTDTKFKGAITDTKDRFDDNRSNVASSVDSNQTNSSRKGITVSLSKFRMPQVPKKHVVTSANHREPETKTKLRQTIKDSKYDTCQELADLKVECANKDKTINEYETYIHDMKSKIFEFENKLHDLHCNFTEREKQYEKDLQLAMKAVTVSDINCQDKLKSEADTKESNQIALQEQINQRDNEIMKLTQAIEHLENANETLESFNQSLQTELDRVEGELADSREEMKNLKQLIREETSEMVMRRRRFGIIMTENRATVTALCQRLAESDAAFEKLQQELVNVRG